jgi:hypothetical protein
MFAGMLGPFYAILPVIGAVRAPNTQTLILLSDFAAWPWATGVFAFIVGLFNIAFHQCWGSVAVVIVFLLGWLMALRRFVLLAFPSVVESIAGSVTHSHRVSWSGDVGFQATGSGFGVAV